MTSPDDLTGEKLAAYQRHVMAASKLRDLAEKLGKETRPDHVWLILDTMRELENICITECCFIHGEPTDG